MPPRPSQIPAVIRGGYRVYVKSHVLFKAADKYCARLGSPWRGTFEVIHQHSPRIFTIDQPGMGLIKLPVEQLKLALENYKECPVFPSAETTTSSPQPLSNGLNSETQVANTATIDHDTYESKSNVQPGGNDPDGVPNGSPGTSAETLARPLDEGVTKAALGPENAFTSAMQRHVFASDTSHHIITPCRESSSQDFAPQFAWSSTRDALDDSTGSYLPDHFCDHHQL